ncbi:hypothetical protein ASG21_03375 [Chryseobacterium sp. Leaf394]|nr:hypothetical protein ASG21_03375 [Chryseobacterium sp. Leaf394]
MYKIIVNKKNQIVSMKIFKNNLLIITLLLLIYPQFLLCQNFDENIRTKTLKQAIIGKKIIYGKWNISGGMETHLTYLGKVKTKKDKVYHLMNYVWIWGLSKRATNKILVYNDLNEYVGEYNLIMMSDLPARLEKNKLIFENKNNDCDARVISKINFSNGIPKEFFRKCTEVHGDTFHFFSS